jgi:prepilin-type processing-associated H-X9-DG protein
MAVHQYHVENNAFPRGTVDHPSLAPEKRLSWFVSLLPLLEPEPDRSDAPQRRRSPSFRLYQQMDLKMGWEEEPNHAVGQSRVRYFLCPSHPNGPHSDGLTDYVGVAGVGLGAPLLPAHHPDAGVFGYDRSTTYEDVKNGISKTMMAVETTLDNGPWAAGGPATVRGLDPQMPQLVGLGRPLGGMHPGGLNVLFADSAVHFVDSNVEPTVWQAAARISGAEMP